MQKIGLEAILKMTNFLNGVKQYTSGVEVMGTVSGAFKTVAGGLGTAIIGVGVAAAGVARALRTLDKAMELGKEGASILQTRDSFDKLMFSMGMGPDVLGKLRDAANGTVDDMTLMSSTLTLVAGTSKTLGQAMVEAAPKLMEIAKAANKLNPTLGDTAFMYESIAKGIKRGQPLILDNLGIIIKVGEANKKMAEQLGKNVKELTAEEKQMAILNATLETGDRMIQQVGGSTEAMGDEFLKAQTKLENTRAEMSTRLVPVLTTLTEEFNKFLAVVGGDLPRELAKTAAANKDTGKTFEQLAEDARVAKTEMFGTEQEKDNVKIFWFEIKNIVKLTGDELVAVGIAAGATWEEIVKVAEASKIKLDRDNYYQFALAAAQARDETGMFDKILRDNALAVKDNSGAVGVLGGEMFLLVEKMVGVRQKFLDSIPVIDEEAAAKRRAALASSQFKNELNTLHAVIAGAVTKEWLAYREAVAALDVQFAAGDLTLKDYTASVNALSEAYVKNTNMVIYNIAEKQILDALEKGLIEDTNRSGTAYDEVSQKLLILAKNLGITDEATAALHKEVIENTTAMIAGKISTREWTDELDGYASRMVVAKQKTGGLTDAIANLPRRKDIFIAHNMDDATSSAAGLGSTIRGIPKNVNINIHTNYTTSGSNPLPTSPDPGAPQPRASGGPIGANQAYIVGERGPELFISKASGWILPNLGMDLGSAYTGTGGSVTNHGPTINMTMNPTINNGMDMAMFKAQILQTVNQALAY